MTPDEVVKKLKALDRNYLMTDDLKESLSSAINLIQDYTRMRDYAQECCTIKSKAEKDLQDYQKLRERISVEIIPELNLAHLGLMENTHEPDKVVCVAGWIRKTIQKLEGKC